MATAADLEHEPIPFGHVAGNQNLRAEGKSSASSGDIAAVEERIFRSNLVNDMDGSATRVQKLRAVQAL